MFSKVAGSSLPKIWFHRYELERFNCNLTSFVHNCRGEGSNWKFWEKKPSSSFNYYKRMTYLLPPYPPSPRPHFEKSTILKHRKNFKQNFVNLTADSIDKIFAKVTLRLWPWLRQNVTVTEKAKPNANLYKQISDDMQEKRLKRKNLSLATYSRRTLQLK